MPESGGICARAKALIARIALWPLVRERRRIAVIFLLLVLVFLYVGRKLVLVQMRPDPDKVYPINAYTRELPATRGPILDRNGAPLAVSVPRWKLAVDAVALPDAATHPDKVRYVYTNLLALGVCPDDRLRETFALALTSKKPRNKRLCETEDVEAVRAIARNRLLASCVRVDDFSRREDFGGRDFAHILGAVNSHGEAQNGIELRYSSVLGGTKGRIVGERTAGGRELRGRRDERIDPVDGAAVRLTIDQALQRIVCEALDDAMDQYDPDAAWAIV